MKFFSIIKAVASGFIWGFGQLLNLQLLKALFFFIVFAGFVGIELSTSSYFEEINAYDKLPGENYGDTYFKETFMAEYLANDDPYEPFEDYLVAIGGRENLDEDAFIAFLAEDLKENNPIRYTELGELLERNPDRILASEFADEDRVHLNRRGTLYYNQAEDLYYRQRTVTDPDGTNKKEFVETTLLTDELNENNVTRSEEGLTTFVKTDQIFESDGQYYLRVEDDGVIRHVNLLTEEIVGPISDSEEVEVTGPLYYVSDGIYEYYEAGMIYNSVRLQYEGTEFSETFRQVMFYTYSFDWNQYGNRHYNRLLLKVHLQLNPDINETFIEQYDNFFYDKAGFFVRSYWSVVTLGVAQKLNFTGHVALSDALVGARGEPFNMYTVTDFSISEDIPIQGHTSTIILLEGLIGIILSFFFYIFMFWSIRDAYRISEAKRKKEKVLKDVPYFKDVYERSFEYIILSPALFVLAFISIMPITFGFIISFTNISGNESMVATFDWVGFKNFIALFNFSSGLGESFGRAFWRVLGWTVVWAILSTGTVFFGGFFQALILNSEKVVFRKMWRTLLILPWAIPALLSQMVFSVMFNEIGFINSFLQDIGVYGILENLGMLGVDFSSLSGISRLFYLGKDNIQWFTNPFNPTFVRATLIVVNIWLGFPYFMALMTGVMTAIDRTLYEAADIDGASNWQKIWAITMPLVLYSTAPILIMTFSMNFNNFGVIYFITGGGPNAGHYSRGFAGDSDILISWMYKLTVDEAIFNMASVFSVLIFLFVGSITAWNLSKTRAFQED